MLKYIKVKKFVGGQPHFIYRFKIRFEVKLNNSLNNFIQNRFLISKKNTENQFLVVQLKTFIGHVDA